MYLFVVTFNDEDKTTELIKKYRENDIRGATIIETMGSSRFEKVESYLNRPLIGGIKKLIEHHLVHNRTLFMVIRTKETLKDAIRVTEEVLGDLSKPGKGIMFALPVNFVKGGSFSKPEFIENL